MKAIIILRLNLKLSSTQPTLVLITEGKSNKVLKNLVLTLNSPYLILPLENPITTTC